MKTKKIAYIFCLLSMCAASLSAYGEACDYIDSQLKPDWVGRTQNQQQVLQGVGSVSRGKLDWTTMRNASKQDALKNLSQAIVVNINAEDVLTLSKTQSAEGDKISTDFKAVSSITTSLTLNEVAVTGLWLDQKRCTLWTLVEISKNKIDNIIADAELNAFLDQAENKNIAYAKRNQGFEQAQAVLEKFAGEKAQLKAHPRFLLRSKLAEADQESRSKSNLMLNNIKSLASSDIKLDQREAYRQTLQLLSSVVFDAKSDALAEPAYYYAAQVEDKKNNSCAAKNNLSKIIDQSSYGYWVEKASALNSRLQCENESLEENKMRALLGGKTVELFCFYKIHGKIKSWHKACSGMGEKLRSVSALAKKNKTISDENFANLLNADVTWLANSGVNAVVLIADGDIKQRDNVKHPERTDYRFAGDIYSYILHNNETAFEDEYSVQSGWNPVSENLVMDILGLNALKRFDKQFVR